MKAGSRWATAAGSKCIRPRSKKELPQLPKKTAGLDVSAHSRNFFDCIKSRSTTAANPQVMRHSHIACHAAALSWILNRKLKFDPEQEMFIDDDEANSLRSRPAPRPLEFVVRQVRRHAVTNPFVGNEVTAHT